MNKDLAAVIERSDAKFEQISAKFEQTSTKFEASNAKFEAPIEKITREQTRWYATIVISGIGALIAFFAAAAGLALHFR